MSGDLAVSADRQEQLSLGDLHQLGERGGVVDGQVSQHLAVDGDVLLLQAIDEGDRKSVV